jgi:hypothetical protein
VQLSGRPPQFPSRFQRIIPLQSRGSKRAIFCRLRMLVFSFLFSDVVLVIIEDSLHSFIFTWPVIEGIGDFASIQVTN